MKLLTACLAYSKQMVEARRKEIVIIERPNDTDEIIKTGLILGIKATIKKIKNHEKDNQPTRVK